MVPAAISETGGRNATKSLAELSEIPMQRGRGRKNAKLKRVMAWIAREVGGFTNQETAKLLRQDAASLSRGISKLAEELSKNSELRRDVERLCEKLRGGAKRRKGQLGMPDPYLSHRFNNLTVRTPPANVPTHKFAT